MSNYYMYLVCRTIYKKSIMMQGSIHIIGNIGVENLKAFLRIWNKKRRRKTCAHEHIVLKRTYYAPRFSLIVI